MPRVPKYRLPPLNLGEETIGKRIARIRKKRGLTQLELARKIGISQKVVTAYETGRIRLYDEMVARFSLALKISSDEILGIKGNNHSEVLPSLRIMKRLKKIENLSSPRKKLVIRMIDDLIKSNS